MNKNLSGVKDIFFDEILKIVGQCCATLLDSLLTVW